jgi:hypothetical protein
MMTDRRALSTCCSVDPLFLFLVHIRPDLKHGLSASFFPFSAPFCNLHLDFKHVNNKSKKFMLYRVNMVVHFCFYVYAALSDRTNIKENGWAN